MNEKFIEKQLKDMKNQIPMNKDLKKELRYNFSNKKTLKWKIPAAAVLAAAVFLITAMYMMQPDSLITKVNAASLKILSQVSFADIEGASGDPAEYNGTLYILVFGKGVYSHDSSGFHKIFDADASSMNISHDGKRLAFSDGNLKIFDIAERKETVLLKSDDFTYYEQPSWCPDGRHIIFVKKVIAPRETHGFEVKQLDIYEIELESKKINKLAEGSSPSYVKNHEAIIFEKENKVISKNLKDKTEKVVDSGRFPSVSPDGEYVAYVKTQRKESKISQNVSEAENIDDIWVSDINLQTKKRITSNFVNPQEISNAETIKNTSKLPTSIEKNGLYSYFNPKWSSDSKNLYVLKDNNVAQNMKLMRISFTDKKLTAEDTVRSFMQALVTRDEEFAKSLMKNPPSIMTVSNPHPVGYRILGSGQENGRDYVDAEIYSAYTAQPDFYFGKERYYLSPTPYGYMIDEVTGKSGGGTVRVSKDDKSVILQRESELVLFNIKDIPTDYLPQGKYRLASLALSEQNNTLIFTIQALQDASQKSSVKVLSYNINTSEFKMIDDIKNIGEKGNVGIASLVIDPSSNHAAVDLFSEDDPEFKTSVFVYDLSNNQKTDIKSLLKNTNPYAIHTRFWDEDGLELEIVTDGQTMSYSYKSASGKLESF
ncbi:MAG TPA: hypothetical protein VIO64_09635 [Pseudobacteroides sp.]|uniref:hypothetical protein n=1 Tax=Pseudobacteroides sp. TaxID=1968840 RepID=UPI002F92EF67